MIVVAKVLLCICSSSQPQDRREMAFRVFVEAALIIVFSILQVLATGSNDYNARCIFPRRVTLQFNPVLHFFSSREHSLETLGCSKGLTFELRPPGKSDHLKLDSADSKIRTHLIDSQLYNSNVVTYFIAHGWREFWNKSDYGCHIKDLILNNSQANVFIVDWSGGSVTRNPVDYGFSVGATSIVAELVGSFINSLIDATGVQDATQFHLIGHSLGSHLFGFVGYIVPRVGRITALDPAGPCFRSSPIESRSLVEETGFLADGRRRLSQASAQLVVAYHTDTALFGLNENCAHYDVYVNGGVKQPNCSFANMQIGIGSKLIVEQGCAHMYSHKIVDTFARFFLGEEAPEPSDDLASNELGQRPILSQEEADLRCYEVAYRCNSYQAFELGECGMCFNDNEPHCVYIGLSFLTANSALKFNVGTSQRLKLDSVTCANVRINKDVEFNEETQRNETLPSCSAFPNELDHFGRHFIKIGGDNPLACLFQYQVVIATDKSSTTDKFYLQLPLQRSGLLCGSVGYQEDRLVQVSHKLADGSDAAEHIRNALRKVVANIQVDDLDLYTALITFTVTVCNSDGSYDLSNNQWHLCRPLDRIKEALLLAQSKQSASAIKWATLIYLSGLESRTRLQFSYLFRSDKDKSVELKVGEKFGFKVVASRMHSY